MNPNFQQAVLKNGPAYKLQATSYKLRNGQLLLELLFAIAVAAAIVGIGSSLIIAALRSSKISTESNVAIGLADEAFEAVRSVAFERWNCGDGIDGDGKCVATDSYFPSDMERGEDNLYYPKKDVDGVYPYKWIDHTGDLSAEWSGSVIAVSALSPRDVWIGTGNGQIWQWNGEEWLNRTSGTAFTSITDIATVSDTEVWVVGSGNTGPLTGTAKVYRWDGSLWVDHSTTFITMTTVMSVSAPLSNRVWIAGTGGNVWRYNGENWAQFPVGITATINSISALGDEAWIAGNGGNVWHYDGADWDQVTGDWGSTNLNSISFSKDENLESFVWFGGNGGDVRLIPPSGSPIHYPSDNTNWDNAAIKSITAFSPTQVFLAAGEGLWGFDSSDGDWFQFLSSTSLNSKTFLDVSDRFSTGLWVVGNSGNVWEFRGAKWILDAVSSSTDDDVLPPLNGVTYSRNFYIQNVCRANSSGDITVVTTGAGVDMVCASGSDYYDPSTLKVTVNISWAGGNPYAASEYITRWDNLTCLQTQWSTAVADSVHNCPTADYLNVSTIAPNVPALTTGDSLQLSNPNARPAATLLSTVFDSTRLGRGPAYNFIHIDGELLDANDHIRVQLSASNDESGFGAAFYGGTPCVSGGWYDWSGSAGVVNSSKEIKCFNDDFHNKQYFRYTIMLCKDNACVNANSVPPPFPPSTDAGPRVDDIIIGYSP